MPDGSLFGREERGCIRMKRPFRVMFGLGLLALLALPAAVVAAPPTTATVVFGKPQGSRPPEVRTGCVDDPKVVPPGPRECFGVNHDSSGNGADDIVPRTAVIAAGQTSAVTFLNGGGRHRVGVYTPGTDIPALQAAAAAFVCPGPGQCDANLPVGRVYHSPIASNAWPVGPAGAVTTPAGTFAEPGRYLMVCTFRPHLIDGTMSGWINVQ